MRRLGLAVALVAGLVIGVAAPALAGHWYGHVVVGPVWWGPGPWGWGPRPWGWYGGWYPPPAYVIVPPEVPAGPPIYVEQASPPQEPAYWYYCEDPRGYFPHVQQCRTEWMTVVPPSTAPGRQE